MYSAYSWTVHGSTKASNSIFQGILDLVLEFEGDQVSAAGEWGIEDQDLWLRKESPLTKYHLSPDSC